MTTDPEHDLNEPEPNPLALLLVAAVLWCIVFVFDVIETLRGRRP